MSKIVNEYKSFAVKGNVLDMAVGIIIGSAFATISNSLVANVIAPVLGILTSGVDLANLFVVLKNGAVGAPYLTLDQANKDGAVTLSYGLFLNSLFSFMIVSWVVFFLVKGINRVREKESTKHKIVQKECKYCFSKVHKDASKCAYCTSDLSL